MKRLFLFITPDGIAYSSSEKLSPDVDNLQVLGYGKGKNEEDALKNFLRSNMWIFNTNFDEIICVEIKKEIPKSKRYFIRDFYP